MSKSCCICSTNLVAKNERLNLQFTPDPNPNIEKCLSSELEIIFVLRNLLHVPSSLVVELFGGNGDGGNPSSWGLAFCSPCRGIATAAHDLYSRIKEFIQDYEDLSRSLRNRAKLARLTTTKFTQSRKRRSRIGDDNNLGMEDKAQIIRRYLMGSVVSSSVTKSADQLIKPDTSQHLKRNHSKKPLIGGPPDNAKRELGQEIQFKINEVGTIEGEGIEKVHNQDNDLVAHFIKAEPEEDMDAGHYSDKNYYGDGDEIRADDKLLTDCSMQVVLNSVEEDEHFPRRTLRARKSKKDLTIGDDKEESENDNEALQDDDGWNQSVTESDEDDSEEEPAVSQRNRRSYKREKNSLEGRRRNTPTTTNRRLKLNNSKSKKCPNCRANCENLVIYEAHVLRMHKGIARPYTCELCPRTFSHLSGVLTHIDERHHSEIKNDSIDVEDTRSPSAEADEPGSESQMQNRKSTEPEQLFTRIFQIDEDKEKDDSNADMTPKEILTTNSQFTTSDQFNKIFTCRRCDVKFRSRITAEIHLQRVHTGIESKLPCSDCDFRFLTELGRRRHRDDTHITTNPETSESLSQLDDHPVGEPAFNKRQRKPSSERKLSDRRRRRKPPKTTNRWKSVRTKPRTKWFISCPDCRANCENLVIYEAHILRVHKGVPRPYTCELCTRTFSHLAGVLTHIDERHQSEIKNDSDSVRFDDAGGPATIFAHENDQLFTNVFQIDEDEGNDTTSSDQFKKIFTCRKCDVKFSSKITAAIHLQRVHTGIQTKFLCSECDLVFLTELGRKRHQDNTHSTANSKIHCKECQLDFQSTKHLGQHIRHIHQKHLYVTREKQYMCELCPQAYADLPDLSFHQRQYHYEELGLIPYKCYICSKVLYSQRNLNAHIATHTKQWKCVCPHCPQGYETQAYLDHHIRVVHFNEKRHKCPHCPKRFSQGVNLKYHIRTHTGEKPLKCSFPGCGKDFADPPTFKRHLESHGDKIHTCPDCGREFKVWHAFRTHCKTHEKQDATRKKRTRTRLKKNKSKQLGGDKDSESGAKAKNEDQSSDNSSSNLLMNGLEDNTEPCSQFTTLQGRLNLPPQLHFIQPSIERENFGDFVMPSLDVASIPCIPPLT